MDKRLAALIACSIGFGQIAGASPISEARIQELMASRDRQEVKLEALRSRDREILVQLGQVLSEKYGSLLEGSEMVFTRLVEQGAVYYRMDFVGLKGRDRARALCEILDVEKCIALGEHGQMTLLQTDGNLTVSATGIVEDTRAFAVLSDEPAPTENPKARQIEDRMRRMLDPLGIFPLPRPDSVGAVAKTAEPVERPQAPAQPSKSEEPTEHFAGRSELDRMLEDGLSRTPEASRRPQARPEAPAEKITVVEYFEETESSDESDTPSEVLIEIDEPMEIKDAADASVADEREEASAELEVIVDIDMAKDAAPEPQIVIEIEDAKAQPVQMDVVVEIEDAKHDKTEPDAPAKEESGEAGPAIGTEQAAQSQEMQDRPVILLPEDLDIRIDVDGATAPAAVKDGNVPVQTEAPEVLPEAEVEVPADTTIDWEYTRPVTTPEAPAPAPEAAKGPMMLTPDMQVEADTPKFFPAPEEAIEPALLDKGAMLSPDMPQSLAEEISRSKRRPRDIASTQDSFLSNILGTSPAAGSPQPGRTIAMRLPGLGEVDFGRLSPSAPSFSADGSARFPQAPAARKAERITSAPAPRAVEDEVSEKQITPEPKPRISEVPEAVSDEKAQRAAEAAPAVLDKPAIHPGPIARKAALEDTKPAPMRLASGPQSRDAALAQVMAKAEPDLGAMPLSRQAALASFEEERRMVKLEKMPAPLARTDALKPTGETRVAQAAPMPKPRPAVLEEVVEVAAAIPVPEPRAKAVVEVAEPAETKPVSDPAPRVAMIPLEGHTLKGGFEVNVPLDLEGMKGGYAAMDAPRLSSDPKVEIALLGTVHFDDQFAVPASLDFTRGRDAGRLQKLPDPRPDLEAVVKRQVSRAGQIAFDPQAARLALDISRGVHPGATLAQVPGLAGTASPDHGMAPPGFFGEEVKPAEPVETSPSLDRLEALLETGHATPEPEVKNEAPAPQENAPKTAPALTSLDALLATTSRPKLTPETEPGQKAELVFSPTRSVPEPSVSQSPKQAAEVQNEEAGAEVEKQVQSDTQRQALEILAQIARRAEQERQETAQATPEPVVEAAPEQSSVAPQTLSGRAAVPAEENVDFDVADLRIELSYVDSRETVKARAGELRAFFPPVMLEKGRFFGASVPGRPNRYIVGLEAKDLKSRDDLIWYMDQMGMPWAMR